MKEIEISGFNRFPSFTKTRAASRAVILRDGQILLSHETLQDTWLIPGGGLETGETPEACVKREVEEETGLLVRPLRHFLSAPQRRAGFHELLMRAHLCCLYP